MRILNDLWMHYAPTPDYADAEDEMLRTFARGVSSSSREALNDSVRVMPFANLKDADDLIKDHGIERATMPTASASASRDRKSPSRSGDPAAATRPSAAAPPANTKVVRLELSRPVRAKVARFEVGIIPRLEFGLRDYAAFRKRHAATRQPTSCFS